MANKNAKYIRPASDLATLHSDHTEIKITRKKNQQYFDFIYKITPKDDRPVHTRVMDMNNKVHFFEGPVPETIKPYRVNIKDMKVITIPVSVNTDQGEDLLNFFLEHPYCEITNYKNDYLLNSIFQVDIRSLIIQGSWSLIDQRMKYAAQIWALDGETTNRLMYYLGGDGYKKTTGEKKIELVGESFSGLALATFESMKKLERFLSSEDSTIHVESLVREAISNKVILSSEEGFTTELGQYLGAKESDVITYYESGQNRLQKLQSDIYQKTKSGDAVNIYDDEDALRRSLVSEAEKLDEEVKEKGARKRNRGALEM